MAFELKKAGVAVVSLWPSFAQTKLSEEALRNGKLSAALNLP